MERRVAVPPRTKERLRHWYAMQLVEGAPVLKGSLFGWAFGLLGQGAVTINGTVHLTSKAPELESVEGTALLGHELYHVVDQGKRGWWGYLARYVWGWQPWHIKDGSPHPLEAAAYARGAEIRRALEGG